MGDPWEKTPDNRQAELGLSHMWSELALTHSNEMMSNSEH